MKRSKAQVRSPCHKIPDLQFEEKGRLTGFAGAVLIQMMFNCTGLKDCLRACFRHTKSSSPFHCVSLFLLLVIHIMLGFRSLRAFDAYREDPLIPRLAGLRSLPTVSTMSRFLSGITEGAIAKLRTLLGNLVLKRLKNAHLRRVTLDFDGSVQSTQGHAEGTAIGYNKKRKGSRSYYPLLCTVAQTGQFFDILHRSGNVHDSKGALEFMDSCLERVRHAIPNVHLETRIDSAFFSEDLFSLLHAKGVEFTCSMPFERFPEFKGYIENQKKWLTINDKISCFELTWAPKSWEIAYRFLVIRQKKPVRQKGPLQLDFFEPRDYEYEYTVITTNMTKSAAYVAAFHHGRGTQEKIIGESKHYAAFEKLPSRRKLGNQAFTLASLMAHNLGREMQMIGQTPPHKTRPKRPPHWEFIDLGSLQRRLFHRPAFLTRPQGKLNLSISATPQIAKEIKQIAKRLLYG